MSAIDPRKTSQMFLDLTYDHSVTAGLMDFLHTLGSREGDEEPGSG